MEEQGCGGKMEMGCRGQIQRLVSEGMWRHRELRLQNDYMAADGCYFLSWQDGNPKRKRSERRQELV